MMPAAGFARDRGEDLGPNETRYNQLLGGERERIVLPLE